MVSSIERFHCIQDSQLGPSGVLYREVPLYTGQPAGSQWCPLYRGSTVYSTASWVPVVSSIERFHCIQDSQLGPSGVLYREVPLYTGQPAGSQWCPLYRGSTVSSGKGHCLLQQAILTTDSQLGPRGVLYREVPLYLLGRATAFYSRLSSPQTIDTAPQWSCNAI